jgi:hypothetical protein
MIRRSETQGGRLQYGALDPLTGGTRAAPYRLNL